MVVHLIGYTINGILEIEAENEDDAKAKFDNMDEKELLKESRIEVKINFVD